MKNQHILNLNQEVPAAIRLEVYKEALAIIESGKAHRALNDRRDSSPYYGLCLLFPCLLWELEHYSNNGPEDCIWDCDDTPFGFPELSKEAVDRIVESEKANEVRIAYLKEWISKLKRYETT